MRIGIIGAGSVGLLIASCLSEKNDVILFTRTDEQASCINKKGIIYDHDGIEKNVMVHSVAIDDSEKELSSCELIFIALKCYSLRQLMPMLKNIEIPVVFLQNGMSHLELVKQLPGDVYFGVVEHGVARYELNKVRRSGNGRIVIGSLSGKLNIDTSEISAINFPFVPTEDILTAIKSKLVINALVNPLTANNRVKNGELVSDEILLEKMKLIFKEVKQILSLENDDLLEKTIAICDRTKENKSSMLQDVEKGRETEIESIMGHLLKIAQQKGIEARYCKEQYCSIMKE